MIINKSPTGVITIPLKAIHVKREDSSLYIPKVNNTKDAEGVSEGFLYRHGNSFYKCFVL
ncbi:hypothetical protein KAM622c_22060 [Klebsiella quasipneumoniae subsp. quasipneumoniae]|nr:hypothetical protein KAM622c_22060 [Klebsiella quasipneumoniae subsp. quasipneumoniae]